MITVKKFLKMRNASEDELNKMIDSMSEEDAKNFIRAFMKTIRLQVESDFDIGIEDK